MIHADTARCLKYDGFNPNTLHWVLSDLNKKVNDIASRGGTKVIESYQLMGSVVENLKLMDEIKSTLELLEYNVDVFSRNPCTDGTRTQLDVEISW